ncbi:MAG: COG1361 S-layer family protein [Candidatus Micrarchaeota archaeon]
MKVGAVLVFLLMAISLAFPQSATSYIVLTDVVTSPTEIYAGDDVNLSLKLYNIYDYTANDVLIQLVGSYPLVEVSPTQAHKMNSIPSGINQPGLEPIVFRLHVDPNAAAGTYGVSIVATYSSVIETKLPNGATSTLATVRSDTMPISIRVRGAPHLSASVLSQGVEPGVKSTITFSIINEGTDTAKSASISLGSTDTFEILGTPATSVGDIEQGMSIQVSFSLRADENALSEKHELPITLKYRNKYGKEFEYSMNVPITVSVYEPLLEMSVSDMTDRPRAGDDAAILLEIRNRGDGLAKNARIEVAGFGPIEVKWPTDNISLGDIPAGAMRAATVKVKVRDGAIEQAVSLPARVSYWNSNKQELYDIRDYLPVELERSANFVIPDSKSELRPGDMWGQVTFTIKNSGNAPAKEVKATLNTQYPIIPSGKEQYLDMLAPGENATISFHVDIDSDAVPQEYPIDIYFQWKEDGDRKHSTSKAHSLGVLSALDDFTMYWVIGGFVLLVFAMMALKKLKGRKR